MAFVVVMCVVVSFVLSVVVTAAVRSLGRRLVLHDTPGSMGHAKQSIRPVPNLGGIAIFLAVAAPMVGGLAVAWSNGAGGRLPAAFEPAREHMQGVRDQTPLTVALLACLAVLHVVGLIDDRRALPAVPKLGVMAAAAAVMVLGFDVRLLEAADASVGGPWLSIVLTLCWFIAVTNAMNFIDNMDGLCGGVSVVAAGLFLAAALSQPAPQWFVGMALALLIGAAAGFLVFNAPLRKPATIFMGDSGSLVIGFLLAFLTVRTTYVPEPTGSGPSWYAVLMPLCVLGVPLYDFVSVTMIRIAQGKSPLVGDQQHLSHRLRARGLTVRQALAVIVGLTSVTGVSGVMLAHIGGWVAALAGAQVLVALAVLAVLEHGSAGGRRAGAGRGG